ncbi:MAG: sigma-70 family RNA polymerase sigma factor, partial [Planctomycetes bacterium]|nr:sigma-70 family RNA polymerase sigma factor [Planctomycetota bacterium]
MRRLLERAFELHLGTSTFYPRAGSRTRASDEDAWQEACLVALLHPERVGELDSWLAVWVRTVAGNALHSERDRREREERTARAEAQPSAIDVIVGQELLHELNTAVAELHEPYRTTICMRFLDDLAPRVIASRTGLPVNTVRTHVRRGLEG